MGDFIAEMDNGTGKWPLEEVVLATFRMVFPQEAVKLLVRIYEVLSFDASRYIVENKSVALGHWGCFVRLSPFASRACRIVGCLALSPHRSTMSIPPCHQLSRLAPATSPRVYPTSEARAPDEDCRKLGPSTGVLRDPCSAIYGMLRDGGDPRGDVSRSGYGSCSCFLSIHSDKGFLHNITCVASFRQYPVSSK